MSDEEYTAYDEEYYETDYEIGQDNVEVFGLDIHNPVFFLSAGLVILFSALTVIFPTLSGDMLQAAKSFTLSKFDWIFAVTPVLLLVFCLYLALSRLGKIRIGGDNAVPEFTRRSWVAMLFAAGVGVGFMFYGTAEPLSYWTDYYGTPLGVDAYSEDAGRLAFSATLFHWGLAPWAIYAMVGLALGFFAHSKELPLTIRSAFYPLLSERIWGWPGHVIDLLAVVSTIFGLATTIGIGATQASNGLAHILGFSPSTWTHIILIAVMTGFAILSVLRGMNGGVKLLSNINMTLAFFLMLFVIVVGPTLAIFTGFFEHTLNYFRDMPALTNWVGREDKQWFHDYTIFYWAWWISWSPFVGMFIARISKGRTVREYVAVVLLVPFTICIFWFTAFGETVLKLNRDQVGEVADGVSDASMVLFQMLDVLPLSTLTSVIAIFLLIVFITTSADSGALVVDTITSGGKIKAPIIQRVFWAAMLGLVSSVLLYVGGKQALQTLQAGTIAAALPFTFILLACCISLYRGLKSEL